MAENYIEGTTTIYNKNVTLSELVDKINTINNTLSTINASITSINKSITGINSNISDLIKKHNNCLTVGIDKRMSIQNPSGWGYTPVPFTRVMERDDNENCFTVLSNGTIKINTKGYYFVDAAICFLTTPVVGTDASMSIQKNGDSLYTGYYHPANGAGWDTYNCSGIVNCSVGDIVRIIFMTGNTYTGDFLEWPMNHLTIFRLSA